MDNLSSSNDTSFLKALLRVDAGMDPSNQTIDDSKTCRTCQKSFTQAFNLKQHQKIHTGEKPHVCTMCARKFLRKNDLTRHIKTHTNRPVHSCLQCPQTFSNKHDLVKHVRESHPMKRKAEVPSLSSKRIRHGVERTEALGIFSITTFRPNEENAIDFLKFFEEIRASLYSELQQEFLEKKSIKWYGVVQAKLTRTTPEGDLEYITPYFRSSVYTEVTENTIESHLDEGFSKILGAFEKFIQGGSNWVLENIIKFDLHSATYYPLTSIYRKK